MSRGQGFSRKFWKDSETINHLVQDQTLDKECILYSNSPEAIYILANIAAKLCPCRTLYNSTEIVNEISDLRGCWPETDTAYLVWFNRIRRDFLFTNVELQTISEMEQIAQLDDGKIYYIAKK